MTDAVRRFLKFGTAYRAFVISSPQARGVRRCNELMSNKHDRECRQSVTCNRAPVSSWVENELRGSEFKDKRLHRRVRLILEQLGSNPGGTVPLACQDWANTKAAYRFFDNDRVDETEILEGHFQATRARMPSDRGPILVLHDTTEFTYKREDIKAIGMTTVTATGTKADGRPRLHTVCGILMHSSLAVTTEGLPLGLAAIKFWSRDKFKGTNALKKKINPTRVPIEAKESVRWLDNMRQSSTRLGDPTRCVHIGDRESDIYELFCEAAEIKTHFLLRTCVNRRAGKGDHTVSTEMATTRCRGLYRVEVCARDGSTSVAVIELRYRHIKVLPPIGKQGRYPSLQLTVLHATERGRPKGRDPIDWKLITDLPIKTPRDAVEKLRWYALRWKIETFHKILKSGCRAEQSKLRTAERLVHLLAIFCIISWRIFWLTMMQRATRRATPTLAFTTLEVNLLSRIGGKDSTKPGRRAASLHFCLLQLARLGGYLNRRGDGPPGNTVMWRGMTRLTDVAIGYTLAQEHVGN